MKVLDHLVEAVDAILATPSTDKTKREIAETLRVVASQISRLQAVIGEHTLTMERTGAHLDAGHRTPAEFLKRECHYSGAQARSVLRSGTVLAESLPHTTEALKAGAITWPHATALVRGVKALGSEDVTAHEEAWISKIAVQSGPERLQRVVRARVHEMAPPPQHQDDLDQDQSTGLALRKITGRGYEITGLLPLADGAVVEEAVSRLRSIGNGHEDVDPIATIATWWLKDNAARQGQVRTREGEETRTGLFGRTRLDLASLNESPTVKRSPDMDPVPLSVASAKPRTVARLDNELVHVALQGNDSCAQPGCSATPHWCDFHGAMDQLGRGLLAAA
ncbi:DUF222 domain-containing protein [Kutzneria buriramensis]|uniref:Uncharacterized protein DUF222 n=1 Tax=Kutzneria buriramensis TaxID=1045776 RepID=A0A3E0HCC9_9PSEU|nr:DUF222 domain-containing protein [Kutzneria buriramensis]REH42083.1 uncharacterized protein DUF222 [Kutzneria buriramensis]